MVIVLYSLLSQTNRGLYEYVHLNDQVPVGMKIHIVCKCGWTWGLSDMGISGWGSHLLKARWESWTWTSVSGPTQRDAVGPVQPYRETVWERSRETSESFLGPKSLELERTVTHKTFACQSPTPTRKWRPESRRTTCVRTHDSRRIETSARRSKSKDTRLQSLDPFGSVSWSKMSLSSLGHCRK